MHTIEKTYHVGLLRDRLHVRAFKTADEMHRYLNRQTSNEWRESHRGLKQGTYVWIAGEWRNVAKVPAELLAHC